jgi:uncharacterized MAPEG superfamily protein
MLEISMLACSALLFQFIWVPVSIAKFTTYGSKWLASNRKKDNLPSLQGWAERAQRAQGNYLENFAPFAVVVLALGIVDGYTYYTGWATVSFFLARITHLTVYMIGWVYLRTLAWLIGLLSTLYLYNVLFKSL